MSIGTGNANHGSHTRKTRDFEVATPLLRNRNPMRSMETCHVKISANQKHIYGRLAVTFNSLLVQSLLSFISSFLTALFWLPFFLRLLSGSPGSFIQILGSVHTLHQQDFLNYYPLCPPATVHCQNYSGVVIGEPILPLLLTLYANASVFSHGYNFLILRRYFRRHACFFMKDTEIEIKMII